MPPAVAMNGPHATVLRTGLLPPYPGDQRSVPTHYMQKIPDYENSNTRIPDPGDKLGTP